MPMSEAAGPLICGAEGCAQFATTLMRAVADAPPILFGNVAVIVADPTAMPLTPMSIALVPAAITTDEGTVATSGSDEVSVTFVSEATVALAIPRRNAVFPRVMSCTNGVSCNVGWGIEIAPSTRASAPFEADSLVAAVPPSSVNCVSEGSSVSEIVEPAGADEEMVTSR